MRGTSGKATEKVLRVGLLTRVSVLDPHEAADDSGHMVLSQVFETPFRRTESGGVEPALFDGPLQSISNGTRPVVAGKIAAGIHFSDGTPLTAAHVVDSLVRGGRISEMATVRAESDRVVFGLSEPNPHFELALTQKWATVVLEKDGRLLGTGAFTLADDSTATRIRLARNPYYRKAVALQEVIFQTYAPSPSGGAEALIAAIEAGEVDFTNMLTREDASALSGVRKLFQPGSNTAILFFNVARPHLGDVRVRRALVAAIDRFRVAAACYANPTAFAARSPLPPHMSAFRDGARHAPADAKTLLGEVGSLPPLRMIVVWGPRPYVPKPVQVAELLAEMWREVGVEVEPVFTVDSADYFRRLRSGDYDLVLGGWIADTPDPGDFLEAILSSALIPLPGRPTSVTCNLSRWEDEETDEALRQLRKNPSEANIEAILQRVADEVPLFPLLYGPTIIVHGWRVRNFEPSTIGVGSFATLDVDEA